MDGCKASGSEAVAGGWHPDETKMDLQSTSEPYGASLAGAVARGVSCLSNFCSLLYYCAVPVYCTLLFCVLFQISMAQWLTAPGHGRYCTLTWGAVPVRPVSTRKGPCKNRVGACKLQLELELELGPVQYWVWFDLHCVVSCRVVDSSRLVWPKKSCPPNRPDPGGCFRLLVPLTA